MPKNNNSYYNIYNFISENIPSYLSQTYSFIATQASDLFQSITPFVEKIKSGIQKAVAFIGLTVINTSMNLFDWFVSKVPFKSNPTANQEKASLFSGQLSPSSEFYEREPSKTITSVPELLLPTSPSTENTEPTRSRSRGRRS